MVERPGVQDGYDLWSSSYDVTLNPIVSMDHRYTMSYLDPQAQERLLDAACGTGRHAGDMVRRGSRVVGLDMSPGMLGVARAKFPSSLPRPRTPASPAAARTPERVGTRRPWSRSHPPSVAAPRVRARYSRCELEMEMVLGGGTGGLRFGSFFAFPDSGSHCG